MTDRTNTGIASTLETAAHFLAAADSDFLKNRLDHLTAIPSLEAGFQSLLNSPFLAIEAGEELLGRVLSLRDSLLAIAAAVREKVERHILFSHRAVEEISCLFTETATFLQTALDFSRTHNAILLRWVENEQAECRRYCDNCMTSHEERLIEGVCIPDASLVYLNMLRGFNELHWQVVGIMRLLAGTRRDQVLACRVR